MIKFYQKQPGGERDGVFVLDFQMAVHGLGKSGQEPCSAAHWFACLLAKLVPYMTQVHLPRDRAFHISHPSKQSLEDMPAGSLNKALLQVKFFLPS